MSKTSVVVEMVVRENFCFCRCGMAAADYASSLLAKADGIMVLPSVRLKFEAEPLRRHVQDNIGSPWVASRQSQTSIRNNERQATR